ncbi:malonate decarboxylase holo-[acyl-carrier-protein] synthase [Methylobacterium fujisawaense]|uniref:Phosphoribosyl-dephospho-CoA transferase n=1 Tax=Methylobacterium fujisawaense TaxID=107400 RepID=A0ABR6DDF6_9HYPH|nr:malonate decarboxylase holo-[acyl-carrier-protein] synthase [Methylobacterium fujisawaense]KOX55932.1 phosphoribosyl-dephospho-CoA transferase [Streptomyces purpurogeneiscleroticus]MBA9064112.1 phosphoribosyl-dephospho-CoA transferase [Methylobacterium fujisawaense]MDH3027424.1 malonate decarboxylase holo-[acyl-carrier-protein] synthase [Methylobacterium fujisawaense]
MAEPFRRHDLVRVDPAAWDAWRADRPDLGAVPHLEGWASAGRPLIVRRRVPGETGDAVPLGLPLPPADGKRRIGLALPASALSPVPAVSLTEAAAHAPASWGPAVDALTALGRRHGLVPRPFGSLLWQAVTGLTYLSAASDLDLLWPCRVPVPVGLLDGIAAVAETAPMGIDGEILLPDGAGLHWRELRDAPEDGSVLAKSLDRLALQAVAGLRGPGPA